MSSSQLPFKLVINKDNSEGNGFYSIYFHDELWLESGQMEAYFGKKWYTANHTRAQKNTDMTLITVSSSSTAINLHDNFGGAYDLYTFKWMTSDAKYIFHTSFKIYSDQEAISFVQYFENGVNGTNYIDMSQVPTNCDAVSHIVPILSFPSFNTINSSSQYVQSNLGFLTWRNTFSSGRTGFAPLSSSDLAGPAGGPIILFDAHNNAILISSNDHFSVSTQSNMGHMNNTDVKYGISASVLNIPAKFQHETVIVFSTSGINDVILHKWSKKILSLYPTQRVEGDKDILTSHIGYWTDNGAYYYAYNFRQNLSCCDTDVFKQVKKRNIDANGIKIHYWQMDDWWMPVTGLGCHPDRKEWVGVGAIETWAPFQPYFAGGLSQLSYDLNVPLALYGPYFSPKNIWIDDYDWIPHNSCYVLPTPLDSYAFYSTLFDFGINQSTFAADASANTGMIMYEVDFMDCLSMTPYFRLNIDAQQMWLNGMNKAAQERGIIIQYCMTLPSNLLSSLTLSQVTNGRASWDYASSPNWNIGQGALLWHALKLKPSKDNFWTTFPQSAPPNVKFSPFGNDQSSCETMAIIAILSCGPVGFSDSIGSSNATIINRTIRADGRLLQPYRPIAAMDDQMIQNVFNKTNINIWNTQSGPYITGEEGSIYPLYQIVLAINMKHEYILNRYSFSHSLSTSNQYIVRKFYNYTQCINGSLAIESGCITFVEDLDLLYRFTPQKPVKPSNESFELMTVIPVPDVNEIVFIGELNKYVSCSQHRFSDLVINGIDSMSVDIKGDMHEMVEVSLLQPIFNKNGDYVIWTHNVDLGINGRITWFIHL